VVILETNGKSWSNGKSKIEINSKIEKAKDLSE